MVSGGVMENLTFIRPENVEQTGEESWTDVRKQLKDITDSTLVNKSPR